MRRRHFLRAMAAISAVAAGLPVMIPAQDPLDAGLGDVEAMRALGRRYLDLHPEETAAARSWRVALVSAGQPGMRRYAARQARLDLEGSTVVVVDGWVLPRALALTCSALVLT